DDAVGGDHGATGVGDRGQFGGLPARDRDADNVAGGAVRTEDGGGEDLAVARDVDPVEGDAVDERCQERIAAPGVAVPHAQLAVTVVRCRVVDDEASESGDGLDRFRVLRGDGGDGA